jgi:hypothetical protein
MKDAPAMLNDDAHPSQRLRIKIGIIQNQINQLLPTFEE